MGKDINLNSDEWRDLVFEGKNKQYGAYKLRQTSSKRHIVAFIIMLCFVGVVAAVPYFIEAVKSNAAYLGGTDDQVKMADLDEPEEEKPEDVIPPPQETPPPPPMKATIQFTPPVVTEDNKVSKEDEMKSQEELNKDKTLDVGRFDNQDGSRDKDALPPEEVLKNKEVTGPPAPPKEQVFKVVEQMPTYPGGNSELFKYLSSSIKYPTVAAENGIEGKVIITFVVGKDGSITNVKVARSLDPSCDKEAVRVVKAMKPWIPGRQNGQNVTVEYTLPVTFKLQK